MPKATKLLHEKIRTVEGMVVELKVWRVRRSEHYPEGFKYSFFAIKDGVVLAGYDNHFPKGHHRHMGRAEEVYEFRGLDNPQRDFRSDLERLRRRLARGD